MDIPSEEYEEILKEIESQDSPVGIDAKKTHIIIISKLRKLDERLSRLEDSLNGGR
jgi:hypothetical protein